MAMTTTKGQEYGEESQVLAKIGAVLVNSMRSAESGSRSDAKAGLIICKAEAC